jgi:serine protease Do
MNAYLKNTLVSLVAGAVGGLIVFGLLWHGYAAGLRQSFFGVSNSMAVASSTSAAELHDAVVVDVVKKVNPAVVSITISQTGAQIAKENSDNGSDDNSQSDPFDQFFNNFFGLPAPDQTPTPSQPTEPTEPNGSKNQNPNQLQEVAAGSGFFVSSDGYIITNKHVVDTPGAVYTVYTNDGKTHAAKVVARDPLLDIAVVKIAGSGYPALALGNSDDIQVGQTAIAIGNALGEFSNTVSVGVISGLGRSIQAGDDMGSTESLNQVIQTDAAINPGNSGGPLLNLEGQVVGINVAVAEESQSIGFALPVNTLNGVLASVRQTGTIVRPYIGVRYTPINEDVKEQYNLSVDNGDLVIKGDGSDSPAVLPGSPAAKAGLKENDIILTANGVTIDLNHDLASMIEQMKVGDKVTLTILRAGKTMTVVVTLAAAPASTS